MDIPVFLHAVFWTDRLHPEKSGILWANGTDTTVGEYGIPFSTRREAEEAAEKISVRQETKILTWKLLEYP